MGGEYFEGAWLDPTHLSGHLRLPLYVLKEPQESSYVPSAQGSTAPWGPPLPAKRRQGAAPSMIGRKESLHHPWQPTRLNGWNSVCSLLHSLCSTCCTNQAEEPCETPKRCSTNITSQAIIAGQGSVCAHNHCHEEQSSTQRDKPPSGRALEMLQARPPADCVLQHGCTSVVLFGMQRGGPLLAVCPQWAVPRISKLCRTLHQPYRLRREREREREFH